MRQRLQRIFQESMERNGLLPTRPKNMTSLRWLKEQGCVTSYHSKGTMHFYPEGRAKPTNRTEALQLEEAFTIRLDDPTEKHQSNPALAWVNEGTTIQIVLKRSVLPGSCDVRNTYTVWVPNELALKALALGEIPR